MAKLTKEQTQIINDTVSLIKSEMKKGYINGRSMLMTVKRPDDITSLNNTSPKHNKFGMHKITIEFQKIS